MITDYTSKHAAKLPRTREIMRTIIEDAAIRTVIELLHDLNAHVPYDRIQSIARRVSVDFARGDHRFDAYCKDLLDRKGEKNENNT